MDETNNNNNQQFYLLPYDHEYLMKMLDRLDKNMLLTPDEYYMLASKPIKDLSTFSGDYRDLRNKPIIPKSLSQLNNDLNFMTVNQFTNKLDIENKEAEKKHKELSDKIYNVAKDLKNINSTASIISNSSALIQNLRSEKSIPNGLFFPLHSTTKRIVTPPA